MTSKRITIRQLIRSPQFDEDDALSFESGVNVIVGKPNSGKSKWLAMLDYLMGDASKPADAFSTAIKDKYDSVRALIRIEEEEELWIERRWKQRGEQGKIFINEKPISQSEFSSFFLEKLGIPVLHFPKGNPFEERAWPELSWRTLLRHIYRQQRFWGNIADQQPESELLASLLQFVGIAEHLYSEDAGALVEIRKQIWKLQITKEQYLTLLDEIAKEITNEKEFQVALTVDSISLSITRLQTGIQELEEKRGETLRNLRDEVSSKINSSKDRIQESEFNRLGSELIELRTKKETNLAAIARTEKRLAELKDYQALIINELGKMERARVAGTALSILKVTNCPVCDQPIKVKENRENCYLCGQSLKESESPNENSERIDNEIKRLGEERKEASELIKKLSDELKARSASQRDIEDDINRIESRLEPTRQTAASILPPDLSIWDMEVGRLQERIRQLDRIKYVLEQQKEIDKEIERLRNREEMLKARVQDENRKVSFESASSWLSDGMNTYLNALTAVNNKLWTQGRVNVKLREKDFSVTVGGQEWSSQLGGTLILYFLLSYHYSLLNLVKHDQCNYPGLTIIDLPPTLEDGSTIRDKENFAVEPFIALLNQKEMQNTQMIITGAAFEDLQGVNRITLKNIWK